MGVVSRVVLLVVFLFIVLSRRCVAFDCGSAADADSVPQVDPLEDVGDALCPLHQAPHLEEAVVRAERRRLYRLQG